MAQPERDPHAHRSVRIVNDAPISFQWKWDSQKWLIPPATEHGPGEAIVPYNAMRVYLGDPEAMNVGRDRYRSTEYKRVRTKHGVNEFNERFACEEGEVPNPWHRHDVTNNVVGQVWPTTTGLPPIRAYDTETGTLLPCPGYDPEGDLLSTETLVLSENASLQDQVAFLQKQMKQLLAQHAEEEDDDDEALPVPEPVVEMKIAKPRRPRAAPSDAEKEMVGAQIMGAVDLPPDRAR